MELNLKGQVAIITGSSTGIGAACAKGLAEEGVKVVINYRSSAEEAEAVQRHIKGNGGEAIVVQADVSKEADVERLVQACLDEYGHLDIMVANAGLQQDAAFTEMSLEQWNTVMDVNLTGQFLVCRAAARIFRKQGVHSHGRAAGKIICMSSVHDEIPWAGHVNYATAKGGVKMLMESMAQELAPDKIRINSVSPGAIKTDINKDAWENPEDLKQLLTLVPYGRIGEGTDVANVVAFLCSDAADYVTGATLYVDGGMMLFPGFADNG
ncbi:SDR family oxidoreductase [Lewinella sp. 4G2]|uniref:SDR family oxidoreductase n=1 Tax=Lewinella sp. 4G2 TaxID=1803372 RepID=UPI0007B4CB76|nr:SDR family oxidoreductase [Lewinella sp. 4G2]OAV46207.1 sugar dehydrogenase [Lewinella sp. 4G2]